MSFGLTGEKCDAQIKRLLQIAGQFVEHREASADMEAANNDIDAACAERACHVQGAWELVALDAHEEYDSSAHARNPPHDTVLRDNGVAFVPAVEGQRDLTAKYTPVGRILHERIQAG